MSPAVADKLLLRKINKKREKINLWEYISPAAISAHQSPLGYKLQRQQDLENVLFNNAAETFCLTRSGTLEILSRSQEKKSAVGGCHSQDDSTLEGRRGGIKLVSLKTWHKYFWRVTTELHEPAFKRKVQRSSEGTSYITSADEATVTVTCFLTLTNYYHINFECDSHT